MRGKKPKTAKPNKKTISAKKEPKTTFIEKKEIKEEKFDEFLEKESKNANWTTIIRNILGAVVIFTIADLIFSVVAALISGTGILAFLDFAVRFVPFFIFSIFLVVFYVIFFIVLSLVYYLIAKIFGGKGSFVQGTTLVSYMFLGFAISFLPVGIVIIFPALNCILLPFGLMLVLYSFYVLYQITLIAHKVDKNKAMTIVFALVVVLAILAFVVAAYTAISTFSFIEPYVKEIVSSIATKVN